MKNEQDLIQEKSARISDIIEQIARLNELLYIHKKNNGEVSYSQQYVEMKEDFIKELNDLLESFALQVQPLDNAA